MAVFSIAAAAFTFVTSHFYSGLFQVIPGLKM